MSQNNDNSYLIRRNAYTSPSETNRQLYVEATFNLTRSLTIKEHDIALQIHFKDAFQYPELFDELTQHSDFTYYKHLCGEYAEPDTPMEIYSMDTQSIVAFDKTISGHYITYNKLLNSKTDKQALLDKYPHQERLINGILNPLVMDEVLAAPNGSILHYDKRYIESHEYTLIERLESYIIGFNHRWKIEQFSNIEEYYLAVHTCNLYASIVPKIMSLREDVLHTLETHTFHIDEYLISNGIEVDLTYLDRKQKFFLYKNLQYIKKYAGHQKTFEMLVHGLFDHLDIPLDTYDTTLRHNPESSIGALQPVFRSTAMVNDKRSITPQLKTLSQYKNLEVLYRRANDTVPYETTLRKQLLNPLGHDYTKLLESNLLGNSNGLPLTDLHILYSNAMYLSQLGYIVFDSQLAYDGTVSHLNIMDIMTFSLMMAKKANDEDYSVIPDSIIVSGIVVEGSITPANFPNIDLAPEQWDYVNRFIPGLASYFTRREFVDSMHNMYKSYSFLTHYARSTEDAYVRMELIKLLGMVFTEQEVALVDAGMTLDNWLIERGLGALPTMTKDKTIELLNELIFSATTYKTGADRTSVTQAATIETLMSLSSYNISCAYQATNVNDHAVEYSHNRLISVKGMGINEDHHHITGSVVMDGTTTGLPEWRDNISFYKEDGYSTGLATSGETSFFPNGFTMGGGMGLSASSHAVYSTDLMGSSSGDFNIGDVDALNSLPQSILINVKNT